MNVKSAFLNGYLKEEVLAKQPPIFESKECPDHVYKLDEALYGFKYAPRAWYENLSKFLLDHATRKTPPTRGRSTRSQRKQSEADLEKALVESKRKVAEKGKNKVGEPVKNINIKEMDPVLHDEGEAEEVEVVTPKTKKRKTSKKKSSANLLIQNHIPWQREPLLQGNQEKCK
uniref:Uncharacterized protein LOC104229205 n=1 Tax=Nicotiana sylvestris TaxID=4096 RepID=A0A1U7WZN4_NICSY|nr:PREDICTED: uncharacterized protein LOC104229205 [Nicotiana sylvestris]